MNSEDREAERQWQRESFGTEGRQMAPTRDVELDVVQDVDRIALFDGDRIDDGQEAWIESDTSVTVGEWE